MKTKKYLITHSECINRAATWLKNQTTAKWRCKVIITEMPCYGYSEIADVLGIGGFNTVVNI
jgi:hypothetical protein